MKNALIKKVLLVLKAVIFKQNIKLSFDLLSFKIVFLSEPTQILILFATKKENLR